MELIILVGNIGTGKTSYRRATFTEDDVIIAPDEWIGLDKEGKQKKMIIDTEEGLSEGKTVVIDGNNMTVKSRAFFIHFANKAQCDVRIVDFGVGDANSLKRRIEDSPETNAQKWEAIHLANAKKYETPNLDEGCDRIINIKL